MQKMQLSFIHDTWTASHISHQLITDSLNTAMMVSSVFFLIEDREPGDFDPAGLNV